MGLALRTIEHKTKVSFPYATISLRSQIFCISSVRTELIDADCSNNHNKRETSTYTRESDDIKPSNRKDEYTTKLDWKMIYIDK
jgi:hypothetical protein